MQTGAIQGQIMEFSASRAFTEAFQRLGSRFGLLVGIWLLFFAAIIGLLAVFGGMFFALIRQTAGGGNPLAGMGGSLIFAGIVAGTQSAGIAIILPLLLLIAVFYLFARLSLVLPLVAIEEVRNPLTAIARAWQLTAHNSIKIALTWGLILIAVFVLYGVGLMVTIGLPAPGNVPGPTGSIAFLILMLVMGLSAGLYMITLTTALYEQLSPSSAEQTAATFE